MYAKIKLSLVSDHFLEESGHMKTSISSMKNKVSIYPEYRHTLDLLSIVNNGRVLI